MTDTTISAPKGDAASLLLVLLKARTFIALILVVLFFSFAAPNFLSAANLVIMSKHVALNAFLAIGMTFVIVSGGIDMSVGSIVGLCGMVAGWLVLYGINPGLGWSIRFNTFEICLIVMAVGVAVGALGTLYIARGAALLSSDGQTFPNLNGNPEYGSDTFRWIGAGNMRGIPVSIWMLVAVGLLAAYIARRTPLGRHIYAVGGNEKAAALSGVRATQIKYFVYVFSGLCAALVGIIIASQLVAAHPATGDTFELNAIAAAVLGGTSMSGGRGRIGGTIVGAFVIGVLSDGLEMMGVSAFWQTVIKGLVIVAAVVINQAQQRVQAKAVLRAQAAIGK